MKRLGFIFLFIQFAFSTFSQKDSAIQFNKGFKSLFINSKFDSTKPYNSQLNPRAISFVQEYIRTQGKELARMKSWGKSYFNLYDGILRQYNIPVEMKYLSVIESHLQSNLVSWAGAVGPWQLMDYEAKRFGLKTGRYGDERTDYIKSTHVACKLMKELYAEFGDWLLVVAAYNGGAGRVRGAIKKNNSKEFWDLQYSLLEETRNHVKKFIATHYVFEGGGGLTTSTASENKKNNTESYDSALDTSNTVIVELTGRYKANVLCEYLKIEKAVFNQLNPNFDKDLAAGKKYAMRLNTNNVDFFIDNKNRILEESYRQLIQGN
ncbi:MAG: lytic transglycosylase domain-containing protein [Chitinophagaceae bacterium]